MSLQRYLSAHATDYPTALAEIKAGRKRSHWMWYIFPQIAGLGSTDTSKHYAIKNKTEAISYLGDETLGPHLQEISAALLKLDTNDAGQVFGSPDDMKLRSSMTLFETVPGAPPVFGKVLDKFYGGERDQRTLDLLRHN